MKLSTRALYGLRAMMVIAQESADGPVMVREIATRQQLPATYLEQVMVMLRKAGLVSATRGAHGGYRLPQHAASITLYEIIEALDGPLALVDCAHIPCCSHTPDMCALKDVLDAACRLMTVSLQQISLAELLEQQQKKEATATEMYMI
jgi:Rrf2 family cysteine metabolism transcriptional repressor